MTLACISPIKQSLLPVLYLSFMRAFSLVFITHLSLAHEVVRWTVFENRNAETAFSIPCSNHVHEFHSSVLIDFDEFDEDPSDTTQIDFHALENTFKESYNQAVICLRPPVVKPVPW